MVYSRMCRGGTVVGEGHGLMYCCISVLLAYCCWCAPEKVKRSCSLYEENRKGSVSKHECEERWGRREIARFLERESSDCSHLTPSRKAHKPVLWKHPVEEEFE